ncbi:putative ATP-dependent RNA helicase DDX58-like [Apostichopus japonicus]|uniref:Putative ATP-dependent RNA helicase DDX58-like n=1 Tax=Stichopus japonicus TaxID=307972 RepID=A0A2G8K7G1_STIJA|nr:putative ATP-dependent RNA helicase DDX58-like [Apostichopus japonicus]
MDSGASPSPSSYSETEWIKMTSIIECFGPPLAEFLNLKELLPNLMGERMLSSDTANQLIRKLDAGSSSDKNICLELFEILKEKLKPDDSYMDFSFGQKFLNCLTTGEIPANKILAKYIEGTGQLHAHSSEEQEFRSKFIKNLPQLRRCLDDNDPIDTLQQVLGHRDALNVIKKGHEGSIDRFLFLVFTLERSPASFREPLCKYLREIGLSSLADTLDSSPPLQGEKYCDEYLDSFTKNFNSLGTIGDECGLPPDLMQDGPATSTSTAPLKHGIIEDKDGNEKENSKKADSYDTVRLEPEKKELLSDEETALNSSDVENIETQTACGNDYESREPEKGIASPGDDDDTEVPAFFKTLRNYQVELAGSALEGHNTIIISPTGTGKTHVAAYIIHKHFNRLKKMDSGRKPKVLFVVHTKVLADQQHKKLEELIGSLDRRILSAVGENLNCPFAEILRMADVVVLTAQVLQNGLTEGEDKVDIGNISLLIFDECHNCHKGHPFNQIMHKYHEEKRRLVDKSAPQEIIDSSVPQIIGMTASIGTGKGKSTAKAFEHILEICANLDTEEVQTVGDKEDLQKYLNIPLEIDPHIVPPRKNDKFKEALETIMAEIEKKLRIEFEGEIVKGKVGDVDISCNGQRDSQIYEAWVKKFERESVKLTEMMAKSKKFWSCLFNLLVYNRGLCLNRDVRMKDAITYLKERFAERRPLIGECNQELIKKFDSRLKYYENLSEEDGENPVLIRLREIIDMEFSNKPDSRALLFTPTVQSTKALKDWIEETREFDGFNLNPSRVTGATELTSAERANTIRKFRIGEHKLLVVTNVVEQGMDVPECNLVIRLNYIPSDTGHIQVKGRNRAKGGKSYLVASSGHGNFKNRELSNRIRENMMKKLLDKLKTIPKEEFVSRVQKIQKKNYLTKKREDQRRERMKELEADDAAEFHLFCINCKVLAFRSDEVLCLRTYTQCSQRAS